MKLRPLVHAHAPRLVASCSLVVLAAAGLLAQMPAHAQSAGTLLQPGTLPVLRGVVSGSKTTVGTAVNTATGRSLTINQGDNRAIIDWQSFNIANGSEVRFNQPSSTASALNRIYGLDPSIIQGKLSANGQILLINQNGILFDRGAQVNVPSLVASTLNMSNSRFLNGTLATGGLTTPAFEGGYDDQGNSLPMRPDGTRPGTIGIGSFGAASASAPQILAPAGGQILMFAPRIDNDAGLISAPDGQVILAAGAKVYLALADSSNTAQNAGLSDNTLRGFVVEVDAASGGNNLDLTNLIRNAGTISADRGNVTLAALAVNQEGRVSASTAIQSNGSIILKARTLGGTQSGTVTLAAGSTTEVMPDATDTGTLAEGQSYASRRGEIGVEGKTINSAGTLQAAGGRIAISASDATDPGNARVYFDQGSVTSVAGNWADVAFAENLQTFKVTSNELKNSPDQKTGPLKGATVTVDLRQANPMLDLSGYRAAQARNVEEKTAVGGDLVIASTGSLIQRAGATLDASGGGYRYGSGVAATSRLLGADGNVYDIGSAAAGRIYTSVLDSYTQTDARWGQSTTYSGLYGGLGSAEAGYVEGKAGGSISLMSRTGLVLDGGLKGGVTVGTKQLASAPLAATLTIGGLDTNAATPDFLGAQRIGSMTLVQHASDTLGSGFGVSSTLAGGGVDLVTLSADQLFGSSSVNGGVTTQTGFGSVELNSNGRISVPAATAVSAAPGSSLLLRAPQIEIAGSLQLPAGSITLAPISTVDPAAPEFAAGHASVTLTGTARLLTAGLWINNASADGSFIGTVLPTARQSVVYNSDGSISTNTSSMLDGGSITIAATSDGSSATLLERGSVLDAGGGAALSSARKITAGKGGKIAIANGQSGAPTSDWLQADLSALALAQGGTLTISTPAVVIDAPGANGTLGANTTRLDSTLFSDHGFSAVTVNTTQGLVVNAEAQIRLQQKNLVIDAEAAATLASGASLRNASTVQVLRDDLRGAVNLTLAGKVGGMGQSTPTLVMAKGASIVADPGATIGLAAVDGLQVDGRIAAPAGNVSLTLNARPGVATAPLTLGPDAAIDVSATFVSKPNDLGLLQGTMRDAGTVTLSAVQTGVTLASGSKITLDGLAKTVQSSAADGSVLAQHVDGNAGTLLIKSQGATTLDAALSAQAPSATGAGGSFALELKAGDVESAQPAERRIVISQGKTVPVAGDTVDAALAIDTLQGAGFQKLRLLSENRIEFSGDVAATFQRGIRLDAPLIALTGNGHVSLDSTSSVAIGQSLDPRSAGSISPMGASPILATAGGGGLLAVHAGTIDLYGSVTVNGATETRLFADADIRFTGRVVTGTADTDRAMGAAVGSFTSEGNLTLSAAQIYPTTRSDFTLAVQRQPDGTLVPGGTITVAGNGATAGDVYSAGGKLTLAADVIVQGGSVKAPLGEIDLKAGTLLELSPGSLTSVSAQGLIIPFGTTQAGLNWTYQDNPGGGTANLLLTGSADAKRVVLNGAKVDQQAGATIDLSGGGDVQALEFVPGTGGSKNTLLQDNTYAIIPASKLAAMPVDTDSHVAKDPGFGLQTAKPDTSVYDSLHIGAGSVLPEGDYVLLPGRYAMLPGAYLVQLQTGSAYSQMLPGQTTALLDGQTVVAGWRTASGTSIRQSSTVGVVVRPGSAATRESDFTLSSSSYFAELASRNRSETPRLPVDAGRLLISGAHELTLGGTLESASSGLAAEVDISAGLIAVVDQAGQAGLDGYLQLEGAALSSLGGSLLLGGERSGNGNTISTVASQVVFANSSAGELKAPEVIAVASDSIELRSGSVVSGSGAAASAASTAPKTYTADAGGALLRASSGAQANVDRGSSTDNTHGDIRIAAGATLKADGALLLDATHGTQSLGKISVGSGGSLAMASSQVSLGETAGVAGIGNGLVLSNADLATLATLDQLVIKGYQGIDLYGNAVVGAATLGTLTLDSGALRAQGNTAGTQAVIAARELHLVNSGGSADAATSAAGQLTLDTQRLVIGAGSKSVSGYATVAANASSETLAQGSGTLAVAGDWTLATPQVGVAAGAVQQWQAAGALALAGSSGVAGTSSDGDAGGRLALAGNSVAIATTVRARSGQIAVQATGAQGEGVTLAAGALLDAAGSAKDYHGNVATASAGQLSLAAASGDVVLQPGAAINLSAAAAGGDAGRLQVAARTLNLSGSVNAAAGQGLGGSVVLDLQHLDDFTALNSQLAAAGFHESIALRQRSGDLTLAAGNTVQAHSIELAADRGRITVAGTLDASSVRGGGSVALWAGGDLTLTTSSQVLANGTASDASSAAALSSGGRVSASTSGGALVFADGAHIDVSPGAKGRTGSVNFGSTRDEHNTMAPVTLAGTVIGQRSGNADSGAADVVLEATRTYAVSGSIAADQIAAYAADHAAFVNGSNAAALLGGVKGDVSTHLRGATMLQADGDLSVSTPWDLSTPDWLAMAEPGTLTLRATGNLTVKSAIGMPNDNLIAGRSWNLRLVGGADTSAANPLATQTAAAANGSGSVILDGNSAKLRTGTGSIEIAAATDFQMNSLQSVIYTAGRIGATDTAVNGNNRWATEGGSISIKVGRDASGASDEWITEWLRRPRVRPTDKATTSPEWWVYRPNFQQGVATLGGGDITIDAGRDIKQLSALLPTTGRATGTPTAPAVDVTGGGNLTLRAGNDISGGSYLVARGDGRISAAGSVGAGAPTQLYLMGASSGAVPEHAAIAVDAGGSITLQSVDNPTTVALLTTTPGKGPSFGSGSNIESFYTYSADSRLDLVAMAGDAVLGNVLASARTLPGGTMNAPTTSGVYPASIHVAAFGGDIRSATPGVVNADQPLVLYPSASASASASLLASGSLLDLAFQPSDIEASLAYPVTNPFWSAQLTAPQLLALTGPRIVERGATGAVVFDLQALAGDISFTSTSPGTIALPAASRLIAGRDIRNVQLTLQNLSAGDLSTVKAESGDVLPQQFEIRGPGQVLVQAGRNVDVGQTAIQRGGAVLGGMIASANSANNSLASTDAARITVLAGVMGDIDLSKLAGAYASLSTLNSNSDLILAFYRALNGDSDRNAVASAVSVKDLAARDKTYAPYVDLLSNYPQVLAAYQAAARSGALPLGGGADATQAAALYALLNRETDVAKISKAASVADLVTDGSSGGSAYQAYVALDAKYPRVFADYQARRAKGALPEGLTPIVFGDALASVVAQVVPAAQVSGGNIYTYQSSIQTYGSGSANGQGSIDLWAPGGNVIAGLTTPGSNTVGVVTNGGGAIRSVVSGDFTINQGKVLTALGGDIMIFSSGGNIDAGKGAKTSLTTPPRTTTPIYNADGQQIGWVTTLPPSAAGSGIQTLSSDPDGPGPLPTPAAGSIYLFAPAGTVDAGEAGIRSGGNLVVAAQVVLNASNISAAGSSAGVPKVESGSLASSLASSGANTSSASKAAEESAAAAAAARAPASTAPVAKATILSVEVMGFGDRNCKEDDKDCFGK